MKIEVGKKYKTRGGGEIKVISFHNGFLYSTLGVDQTGFIRTFLKDGQFSNDGKKHKWDLVEEIKEEETSITQELLEISELQLEIIYRLIGNKKVVNLDESIAYFESIIKKAKNHEK